MVYNDCNNQLFQSAAIKIKTPIRSAGTECCLLQVLLIAGCHLGSQQGNTGLFFLSIRTDESLFCFCYHFLLSNTKSQTEGLWGEVQAPSAFLLSCLERRWARSRVLMIIESLRLERTTKIIQFNCRSINLWGTSCRITSITALPHGCHMLKRYWGHGNGRWGDTWVGIYMAVAWWLSSHWLPLSCLG